LHVIKTLGLHGRGQQLGCTAAMPPKRSPLYPVGARDISSSSVHSELVGLPPGDLESGGPIAGLAQGALRQLTADHVQGLHYIVYFFSLVVFIFGFILWMNPAEGFFDKIGGTLLFVCGIFLMLNSDLVVTCIRMQKEVWRFQHNNRVFDKHQRELSKQVRELQLAQKGLQELDKGVNRTAADAQRQVDSLKSAARSNITNVAKHICHLYGDASKDRKINLGAELSNTLEMFEIVFGGVYEDFPDRSKALREAIEGNKNCQSERGVEVRIFAELVPYALDANYKTTLKPNLEKLLRGDELGPEDAAPRAGGSGAPSGKSRISFPNVQNFLPGGARKSDQR